MTNRTKILVMGDTHVPYQNKEAVEKAIQIGKELKPDKIVLLGDMIDCVSISRFVKRMDERDFNQEVKETRKFLERLRKTFPKAEMTYLEGNHEERITHYLLTHADALSTLEELSLPSL